MPARLRLDRERSIEIALARLSPRYGCGLMLKKLDELDSADPLISVMGTYGYDKLYADKPGGKLVTNPALLKSFYDNALSHKTPVRRNWHTVYREVDVFLALDKHAKTAWFVGDPLNRMALVNYFRDAVSLGVKTLGIMLVGSTVRLTPAGWQNLHDLLSDEFVDKHKEIERVDVMSMFSGVRWRQPSLGIGVTFLNLKDPEQIREAADTVLAGGGEILG